MIYPRFTLNFTAATLDPRITFARSGATATRVNSSGFIESVAADAPRFDYDPITLACKGLLIEESRLNLLKYSGQIGDAAYYATNPASGGFTVSLNTLETLAPDGTYTATKLVKSSSVTTARVGPSPANHISGTAQAYTVSVFVKYNGIQWFCIDTIEQQSGTRPYTFFDVQNGVIGTVGSGITARITNNGNGWYRCSITYTAVTPANFPMCSTSLFRMVAGNGDINNFAGNDVNGIYIWGGQVEAGAFQTSYIPTTTAAVTRNADVATITGTNFSDWWQASQGGVLVRARPGTVSGVRPWVQFDDGTANEIIALRGNTTNPELYIVDNGAPQAQLDAGTIAANTDYSLTGWWQTNDCRARLDNGAVVTDTSATIPTVTQARLGSDGTNYLNGHLASVSYYDQFSSRIYTRRKNKAVFSLL